ncbi:HYR domain-containing protein [Antarcticibacterium flavum]|uniref:HYR domain-containing protein n=1 Tax=Antarcticibacterium flavum TaxID=2058175 RepID=A0A5B7X731_9FLAO|nr:MULTISPECIES: HYR domain-containing protein [Antarcticibacterium]MCM4161054.1 hypothetical protein [Antarcticibacterium sp. W02-3]QCY70518.1 HYR domain-containing protein [Antarcticibacterium flavum]
MSGNTTCTSSRYLSPPGSLGKGRLWVLVFVVFFSFFDVVGQSPGGIIPSYVHVDEIPLPTVTLTALNTEDITIAVTTDRQGNIYTLSFGNRVVKRSPDGTVLNTNFISAGNLNSPLDIAIDSAGLIYIADYSETNCNENGKIKVFDQNGTYLPNRTIFTSFYRPLGIDVDNDQNIYVAEYNAEGSGCEGDEMSRISIYDTNTRTRIRSTNNVTVPLRIAVNSQKRIYVSQAGNNNASVRIFNENLVYQASLPNIVSPGSVVVDHFDFVHVIEYGSRIKFQEFLDFETLDLGSILSLSGKVYTGQQNNEFFIKIYDQIDNKVREIKNEIDFPLDIAFNSCDKMIVNNGEIRGTTIPFLGFVPSDFKFTLEIYKRTPSFDSEAPVFDNCPSNITEKANPGNTYAVVNFNTPTAKDNCSVTVTQTSGLPSGSQFPVGTHTIEFTATDLSGNNVTCSFTIIVEPADAGPDPSFSCSAPSNLILELNSNCGYNVPNYRSYITNPSDFSNSPYIVQEEEEDGNSLNITLNVYDGENGPFVDSCTFTVALRDITAPVIDCSVPPELAANSQGKYIIPDFSSRVSDNCDDDPVINQNPTSGTEVTVDTEITLTATDAAGNTSSCSFMLILEEAEEQISFDDCPSPVTAVNDPNYCGAIVNFPTPTASGNSGAVQVNVISSYGPGFFFPLGTTTVIFEAVGANGARATCRVDVIVTDNEAPVFTDECEGLVYTAGFEISEGFEVPNFAQLFRPYDNCDNNITIVQDPRPGTVLTQSGTYPTTLTVTDNAGNSSSCSFEMSIISMDSFDLICSREIRLPANDDCEFILPDLSEEYNFFPSSAVISQSIPTGELLTEDTEVVITATYDGEEKTCRINIKLVDYIWPEISCLPSQNVPFTPSQGFEIPNYVDEIVATDNCEVVSVIQDISPGTIVREDSMVTITATDNFGNTRDCFVYIYLQDEPDALEITCPQNQFEEPDAAGNFILPNYSTMASATPGAVITQSPPAGTTINSISEITLTATLDGESVSCSFNVSLQENTPPVAQPNNYQTPQNTALNVSASQGVLNNDTDADGDPLTAVLVDDVSSGTLNLNPDGSFSYVPDNGFTGVAFFTYVANDGRDNSNTVSVRITVTTASGTNTPPTAQADAYETPVNTTLNISAAQGVLSNDTDVDGDELTAVLLADVSDGELTFNADGSFTYVPDQGFLGVDEFVYEARDAGTTSGSTTVTITVFDDSDPGGDFTCRAKIIVYLDENGEVVITPNQLYNGDAGQRVFSLGRDTFTCEHLGENTVGLFWTGEDEGNCAVIVEVRDNIRPVVNTNNLTVALNENGRISVTPALINNGSHDNCGITGFSLSKTEFTCKDLGRNEVRFTATDASGNSSSQTVTINVTGNCDGVPGEETDHIIIYPNPTTGPFTIAKPEGVIITRIEVFDFRGRFIMARDFPENSESYTMDLTGLQHAVYVLNIITSERNIIRRVIVY